MNSNTLKAFIISGVLTASGTAMADHNSIWGEGFANMPNDIHNTRIEDDDETFMDLVQYGDGVDSENRYADDDTTTITSSTVRGVRSSGATRPSVSRMSRR